MMYQVSVRIDYSMHLNFAKSVWIVSVMVRTKSMTLILKKKKEMPKLQTPVEARKKSENSEEEEQDGDQIQGVDLSDASEVASSRAPSKRQSSQKHLAMLVRNLQKEVENLKSTSQAHPVDELSALNLYKRRRFRSPVVEEDEEASSYVDCFASDYGY